MTFSIGRIGATSSGWTLTNPTEWVRTGPARHLLSGRATFATINEAVACIDQLTALADNPDEPAVPIVWTDEPSMSGFYRIRDVTASIDPDSWHAASIAYTVDAERVAFGYAGYSGAESSLVGAVITNGHSVSTSQIFHAAPNTVDYNPSSTVELNAATTVTTETGVLAYAYRSTAGSGPWNLNSRFTVAPDAFYTGAAKLEVDLGGGAWRTVVGRNLEGGSLRFNNGLIRVVDGLAAPDIFNGSAWELGAGVTRTFGIYSDGSTGTVLLSQSLNRQILRNSPEEVAVRYTYSPPGTLAVVTVDVSLRRGAFYVTGLIQASAAYTWATRAAGATYGGSGSTMHRGADDAFGNRWFSMWAPASTVGFTSGTGIHYLNAAATTAAFAHGVILNYSTASAPFTPAAIHSSFWGQLSERMAVVRR